MTAIKDYALKLTLESKEALSGIQAVEKQFIGYIDRMQLKFGSVSLTLRTINDQIEAAQKAQASQFSAFTTQWAKALEESLKLTKANADAQTQVRIKALEDYDKAFQTYQLKQNTLQAQKPPASKLPSQQQPSLFPQSTPLGPSPAIGPMPKPTGKTPTGDVFKIQDAKAFVGDDTLSGVKEMLKTIDKDLNAKMEAIIRVARISLSPEQIKQKFTELRNITIAAQDQEIKTKEAMGKATGQALIQLQEQHRARLEQLQRTQDATVEKVTTRRDRSRAISDPESTFNFRAKATSFGTSQNTADLNKSLSTNNRDYNNQAQMLVRNSNIDVTKLTGTQKERQAEATKQIEETFAKLSAITQAAQARELKELQAHYGRRLASTKDDKEQQLKIAKELVDKEKQLRSEGQARLAQISNVKAGQQAKATDLINRPNVGALGPGGKIFGELAQSAGGGPIGMATGMLGKLGPYGMAAAAGLGALAKAFSATAEAANAFYNGQAMIKTLVDDKQAEKLASSQNILRQSAKDTGAELGSLQKTQYILSSASSQLKNDLNAAAVASDKVGKSAVAVGAQSDQMAFALAKTAGAADLDASNIKTMDLILDTLTGTMKEGLTTGGELAESFAHSVKQVRAFTNSGEEAVKINGAMMAALTNTGASASEAATQMNAFFQELGHADNAAKLVAVGVKGLDKETKKITNMEEFNKSIAQNSKAVKSILVSAESAKVLNTMALGGGNVVGDQLKTFNAMSGNMEAMYGKMADTAQTQGKRLDASWNDLMINLGESSKGFKNSLIGDVIPIIQSVSDYFKPASAKVAEFQKQLEKTGAISGTLTNLGDSIKGALESGKTSDTNIKSYFDMVKANLKDIQETSPYAAAELAKILNDPSKMTVDGLKEVNVLLEDTNGQLNAIRGKTADDLLGASADKMKEQLKELEPWWQKAITYLGPLTGLAGAAVGGVAYLSGKNTDQFGGAVDKRDELKGKIADLKTQKEGATGDEKNKINLELNATFLELQKAEQAVGKLKGGYADMAKEAVGSLREMNSIRKANGEAEMTQEEQIEVLKAKMREKGLKDSGAGFDELAKQVNSLVPENIKGRIDELKKQLADLGTGGDKTDKGKELTKEIEKASKEYEKIGGKAGDLAAGTSKQAIQAKLLVDELDKMNTGHGELEKKQLGEKEQAANLFAILMAQGDITNDELKKKTESIKLTAKEVEGQIAVLDLKIQQAAIGSPEHQELETLKAKLVTYQALAQTKEDEKKRNDDIEKQVIKKEILDSALTKSLANQAAELKKTGQAQGTNAEIMKVALETKQKEVKAEIEGLQKRKESGEVLSTADEARIRNLQGVGSVLEDNLKKTEMEIEAQKLLGDTAEETIKNAKDKQAMDLKGLDAQKASIELQQLSGSLTGDQAKAANLDLAKARVASEQELLDKMKETKGVSKEEILQQEIKLMQAQVDVQKQMNEEARAAVEIKRLQADIGGLELELAKEQGKISTEAYEAGLVDVARKKVAAEKEMLEVMRQQGASSQELLGQQQKILQSEIGLAKAQKEELKKIIDLKRQILDLDMQKLNLSKESGEISELTYLEKSVDILQKKVDLEERLYTQMVEKGIKGEELLAQESKVIGAKSAVVGAKKSKDNEELNQRKAQNSAAEAIMKRENEARQKELDQKSEVRQKVFNEEMEELKHRTTIKETVIKMINDFKNATKGVAESTLSTVKGIYEKIANISISDKLQEIFDSMESAITEKRDTLKANVDIENRNREDIEKRRQAAINQRAPIRQARREKERALGIQESETKEEKKEFGAYKETGDSLLSYKRIIDDTMDKLNTIGNLATSKQVEVAQDIIRKMPRRDVGGQSIEASGGNLAAIIENFRRSAGKQKEYIDNLEKDYKRLSNETAAYTAQIIQAENDLEMKSAIIGTSNTTGNEQLKNQAALINTESLLKAMGILQDAVPEIASKMEGIKQATGSGAQGAQDIAKMYSDQYGAALKKMLINVFQVSESDLDKHLKDYGGLTTEGLEKLAVIQLKNIIAEKEKTEAVVKYQELLKAPKTIQNESKMAELRKEGADKIVKMIDYAKQFLDISGEAKGIDRSLAQSATAARGQKALEFADRNNPSYDPQKTTFAKEEIRLADIAIKQAKDKIENNQRLKVQLKDQQSAVDAANEEIEKQKQIIALETVRKDMFSKYKAPVTLKEAEQYYGKASAMQNELNDSMLNQVEIGKALRSQYELIKAEELKLATEQRDKAAEAYKMAIESPKVDRKKVETSYNILEVAKANLMVIEKQNKAYENGGKALMEISEQFSQINKDLTKTNDAANFLSKLADFKFDSASKWTKGWLDSITLANEKLTLAKLNSENIQKQFENLKTKEAPGQEGKIEHTYGQIYKGYTDEIKEATAKGDLEKIEDINHRYADRMNIIKQMQDLETKGGQAKKDALDAEDKRNEEIIKTTKGFADGIQKAGDIYKSLKSSIAAFGKEGASGGDKTVAAGDIITKVGEVLLMAPNPQLQIAGAVILGIGFLTKIIGEITAEIMGHEQTALEKAEGRAKEQERITNWYQAQNSLIEQVAAAENKLLDTARERAAQQERNYQLMLLNNAEAKKYSTYTDEQLITEKNQKNTNLANEQGQVNSLDANKGGSIEQKKLTVMRVMGIKDGDNISTEQMNKVMDNTFNYEAFSDSYRASIKNDETTIKALDAEFVHRAQVAKSLKEIAEETIGYDKFKLDLTKNLTPAEAAKQATNINSWVEGAITTAGQYLDETFKKATGRNLLADVTGLDVNSAESVKAHISEIAGALAMLKPEELSQGVQSAFKTLQDTVGMAGDLYEKMKAVIDRERNLIQLRFDTGKFATMPKDSRFEYYQKTEQQLLKVIALTNTLGNTQEDEEKKLQALKAYQDFKQSEFETEANIADLKLQAGKYGKNKELAEKQADKDKLKAYEGELDYLISINASEQRKLEIEAKILAIKEKQNAQDDAQLSKLVRQRQELLQNLRLQAGNGTLNASQQQQLSQGSAGIRAYMLQQGYSEDQIQSTMDALPQFEEGGATGKGGLVFTHPDEFIINAGGVKSVGMDLLKSINDGTFRNPYALGSVAGDRLGLMSRETLIQNNQNDRGISFGDFSFNINVTTEGKDPQAIAKQIQEQVTRDLAMNVNRLLQQNKINPRLGQSVG